MIDANKTNSAPSNDVNLISLITENDEASQLCVLQFLENLTKE